MSRLEEMHHNIPLHRLQQTHRDAVIATISLGVEYLWIDALCILQDSKTDWQIESMKMDQYYRNSYVTICVDAAVSSNDGFLSHRSPSPFDSLHMKQQIPSGSIENLFLSRPVYGYFGVGRREVVNLWYNNVEMSPLASRAWAFQERLLSPRKIHYGQDQIFWECRHHRQAEDGATHLPKSNWGLLKESDFAFNTTSETESRPLVYKWYDLVERYSARRLTRISDRLRAISGMVKVIEDHILSEAPNSKYVAGLWTHALHWGLSWRIEAAMPVQRPEDNHVPSWSWASTDGEIVYSVGGLEYQAAFELISASLPPLDDPYGSGPNMCLNVRGRLQRAVLKSEHPQHIFAPAGILDSESVVEGGLVGDYWDDLRLARRGDHFQCLQLWEVYPTSGPSLPMTHPVVLLAPAADIGKNCFRRIGYAKVYHDDWFRNSPLGDIAIY